MVERLIDTVVVVLLIALSLSQLPDAPPQVYDSAALTGIAATVGIALLLALALAPQTAQRLLERLLAALPQLRRLRLQAALTYLLDGLRPLADKRAFFATTLWTAVAWAISLLHFYLVQLALGIELDSLLGIPLGVSLAALSLALPVSIAGIGAFEAAIVVTGSLVGMTMLESLSLGFLLHGMTVLSNTIWGFVGIVALGVSPTFAFARKRTA